MVLSVGVVTCPSPVNQTSVEQIFKSCPEHQKQFLVCFPGPNYLNHILKSKRPPFCHHATVTENRLIYPNPPHSAGTACSRAALLTVRPALIRNNAQLIRMRAEITAENKHLWMRKGPEGAPGVHVAPEELCGWSRLWLQLVKNLTSLLSREGVLLQLGLVTDLPDYWTYSHPSHAQHKYQNNDSAWAICFSEPLPHRLKTYY